MRVIVKKTSPTSDFVYAIDESAGTVIAILTNTKYTLRDFLIKHSPKGCFAAGCNGFGSDVPQLFLDDFYYGKAQLHSKDVWDEDYGMELAKERALKKYHRARARKLSEWIAKMEQHFAFIYQAEEDWTVRLLLEDFGK